MSNFGLVSIITPSFNCANFIGETIDSILAQTYQNWELLITDDCSTDNSREIISRYASKDPRIKLLNLAENSGAGIARNNSIKEAKGRFIAFCDSDDRWYPDKFEKQIEFMTSVGCAMTYTSYMTCNEAGENTGIIVCRRKETINSIKRDDKIGCLTVMYDVEKVGKIFMPDIRKRQDWAFKIRVLSVCKVAYGMKEPLALYRLRNNSLSNKKTSLIKYNIAVYHSVLRWSWVKSYLYFGFIFLPCYIIKRMSIKYINR